VIDPLQLPKIAKQAESANKKFFAGIKKKKPTNLDSLVHELHEEVFEETDCLSCANCCKTTSPIFKQKDIERLAPSFKLKPGDFIQKYLFMDEDGDYVHKGPPCPFLGQDNYCSVYEVRPDACRQYPHTDRKRFHEILNLTIKNTFVCPAAYEIVERMKKKF
jgi:Fe-S-cluster containining protein